MGKPTTQTDFLVRKGNLHSHEFRHMPLDANTLADGEVLLKVDRFAFTANNVTYAAFGDAMNYWGFFPAPEGFGRVPVWGFGDVVASRHGDVKVGERFYGYYPMSTHLKVLPARVSAAAFTDGAAHRKGLPVIYNQYVNVAGDPSYRPEDEDLQSLFRPLFMTSFLIDDFLADNSFFGATQVVLSSASSKTAFGTAFLLAKRPGINVVGLTSPGNVAFTESLGCYDRVIPYDAIGTLEAGVPTVYVDMAGSGQVRAAVHGRFDEALRYSCSVGASHWDQMGANTELKGPKPTLFFAPAQAEKRIGDWGGAGFQARTAAAWADFMTKARGWLDVRREKGEDAIARVYGATVEGAADPKTGYILSF